jgi:protein-S-isoprenylcysteine O-methyltransferase Ste14
MNMTDNEKISWTLGCVAFVAAAALFAMAVTIVFTTHDGVGAVGWLLAGAGWWLSGVGVIANGKLRHDIDRALANHAADVNGQTTEGK